MYKPNRQMMVIAASLAAGVAIRTLFVSARKNPGSHRRDLWIGKCSKQKLEMVKGKLETHKIRLERVIEKINTRLGELEP